MKKIKILNTNVRQENVIESEFIADKELEKYFTGNTLLVEYGESVAELPQAILNVPVFYNLLPVALFLDVKLEFDELDRSAFESVEKIREGYQQIYPELFLGGDVKVKKLIDQSNDEVNQKSGMLFTGGVDSTASLIEHISEKPESFTVWGADVALSDQIGWQRVKVAIEKTCKAKSLNYNFVKSNFKDLMNQANLNGAINSSFGWWYNAHHSLGLAGVCMPIIHKHAISTFYIPGTHDIKFNTPLASDPLVDNHIACGNLTVIHDLFELNRQMKAKTIINYSKQNNTSINLRVCWEGDGGINCQKCEKCVRTIINIILAGGDPREFGFPNYDSKLAKRITKNYKQGFYHVNESAMNYQYSMIQEEAKRVTNYSKENAILIDYFKKFDKSRYPQLQNSFRAKLNRITKLKLRKILGN